MDSRPGEGDRVSTRRHVRQAGSVLEAISGACMWAEGGVEVAVGGVEEALKTNPVLYCMASGQPGQP
jgi:hypothetical protein